MDYKAHLASDQHICFENEQMPEAHIVSLGGIGVEFL